MAQNINGVHGDCDTKPYTLARTPALAKRKWAMWAAAAHPWGAAAIEHGQPVQSALQPVLRANRNKPALRVARYNKLNNF